MGTPRSARCVLSSRSGSHSPLVRTVRFALHVRYRWTDSRTMSGRRQQGHRLVTVLPPIAERALEDAFAPVAVHAGDVRQDIPDTSCEDHGARIEPVATGQRPPETAQSSPDMATAAVRPHGHGLIWSQLLVADAAKLGRRRSVPREEAVGRIRRRVSTLAGIEQDHVTPAATEQERRARGRPVRHRRSPRHGSLMLLLLLILRRITVHARHARGARSSIGTTTIPAVHRMQTRLVTRGGNV